MVGKHTYPDTRRRTDTHVNKRAEPLLSDRTSVEDNDAHRLRTASKTTPSLAPPRFSPRQRFYSQEKKGEMARTGCCFAA